jgi:hypothetical protein
MSRSELPSLAATDIFGTPDMMHTLTGGQAIVNSPLSHGVGTVFGIPGVQTYGFLQATAYMAFRYAKTIIPISSVQLERTREVSPCGLLMPPAKRNDR